MSLLAAQGCWQEDAVANEWILHSRLGEVSPQDRMSFDAESFLAHAIEEVLVRSGLGAQSNWLRLIR
ncbi:MAG: hypothetical protein NT013_27000 [Planctomycetia bacterium]|nr:hypothetical protein [Planctomycetia bacterium]